MRMAKIGRIALLLVFLVGLAAAAQADALEDIIQRGELRVAVQTQGRWADRQRPPNSIRQPLRKGER